MEKSECRALLVGMESGVAVAGDRVEASQNLNMGFGITTDPATPLWNRHPKDVTRKLEEAVTPAFAQLC